MSQANQPNQIRKGHYLIVEYVGDNDDYEGNYALFYENDNDPLATVNWINFAGHGIATRQSLEINQKTRVEVNKNGTGAYIKSGWD